MSAYIAGRVAAVLGEHGETMTLQRTGQSDLSVKGKRLRPGGAGSSQAVGAVAQNMITVKISNAEIAAASWPGPPRKGDKLVMGGRTYTLEADSDVRGDAGTTLAHFLVVKG